MQRPSTGVSPAASGTVDQLAVHGCIAVPAAHQHIYHKEAQLLFLPSPSWELNYPTSSSVCNAAVHLLVHICRTLCLQKDIILYDNDADFVVLNPDWDTLLETLRDRLKPKGFRVFYVVPSEDRSIKWIRVVSGVGIMDLYGGFTDLTPNSSSNASTPAAAADHPTEQQKALAAAAAASVPMVSIPQGHGDLCDVPASYIFPLGVMKFRGVPVSVPGDVCGVLRYRYGDTFLIPRYMDKGRDCVEQGKLYARLLGALGKAGLRV
eukprot:GHUV01006431.1.p1 GENE.GHUV01006431.1~~GHUV01006431.1.p1  ORF type:complete len:264 (+),score=60.79 GHUV01006431.1:746-1537(+)